MSLARPSLTLAVLVLFASAAPAGPAPARDAESAEGGAPTKPSTLFRENPPEPDPAERPPAVPAERPPAARTPEHRLPPPRPGDRLPPAGTSPRPRTGKRHPVPDPAAQGQALQLLRELFSEEYHRAEISLVAAKELTNELIRQAAQMRRLTTPDDVASRYVLLKEAIALATAARDYPTALNATNDLAEHYDADGPALKMDLLAHAGREAIDPAKAEPLVRAAFGLVDEAVAAADLPGAAALLSQADVLARKAKSVPLATEVQKRRKELRDLQGEYRNLPEAAAKLRDAHADPAANLALGRFHCFVAGNWDVGLPMLALCSEAALRDLASRDLEIPPTGNEKAELADGWWALAEQQTGRARDHIRARSAYWYRQAMQDLGGLKRVLAQKRIDASPSPVNTPGARPPTGRSGRGPIDVVTDPPAAAGGGTRPEGGPAQRAADVLRQIATRLPPDARPLPGEVTDPSNAHQWLRANLRPGTPITGTVELLHCSGVQRRPSTNTPYVNVTFRVAETVEHAGIRHTMDFAAKLEDEQAMEVVNLARGQIGQFSGTLAECRLGGWQGNKEKGLGGITFLALTEHVRFVPGAP